jgi:predicted MPP superfamily phosphohydrolase
VSLASLPYLASTYGAFLAADHVVIERVTIPIKDLPDPLVGLKIVQLSDIHVGIFMPEHRVREYAGIVNRLEPDLVLLTGDYVSSSDANAAPFVRAASHLRAKHGVFGCVGNHDLFTLSVPLLTSGFSKYGMKLLHNEQVWLNINGTRLNLIGVEFLNRAASRFDQAIRGLALDGPSILLSHHPNTFPQAASRAIDLTLSGHTHGGQMKVELLGLDLSPARLITPYAAGLFEIGDSKLYVNRGLGTTGPPIRFSAPPEITLITLTR